MDAEARERTAQSLCLHFAADHLAMDVLEDRLTRVYRAQSDADLVRLTADLPPIDKEQFNLGAPANVAAEPLVQERGRLLAFLGGAVRKGSWVVPRHLDVRAYMGGVELDLREAQFAAGVTEIHVSVVMGGVDISLPPGVRVEVSGSAILGGFDADNGEVPIVPGQPVIRLTGVVLLGGVSARARRLSQKMLKRMQKAESVALRLKSGGR